LSLDIRRHRLKRHIAGYLVQSVSSDARSDICASQRWHDIHSPQSTSDSPVAEMWKSLSNWHDIHFSKSFPVEVVLYDRSRHEISEDVVLVIVPQTSVQGEPAVVLSPKTAGAAARRIASMLEDRGLPSQSPSILDRSEQSDNFCSYSNRQGEKGGSKGRAP
jgi:hypothetical protein